MATQSGITNTGLAFRAGSSFPNAAQLLAAAREQTFFDKKLRIREEAENKKFQRTQFAKALEFNPQAAISSFQPAIAKKVDEDFFNLATKIFDPARAGLATQQDLTNLAKVKNNIEADVNKVEQTRIVMKQNFDLAKANSDTIDAGFVMTFMDEVKTKAGKDINNLNIADLQSVWENKSTYKLPMLVDKYAKTVEEKITTGFEVGSDAAGNFQKNVRFKSKFALMKEDGSGPEYHTTGRNAGKIMLEVTPEQLSNMKSVKGIRVWIDGLIAEARAGNPEQGRPPDLEFNEMDAAKAILQQEGYARDATTQTRVSAPRAETVDKVEVRRKKFVDARLKLLNSIVDSQDAGASGALIGGEIIDANFVDKEGGEPIVGPPAVGEDTAGVTADVKGITLKVNFGKREISLQEQVQLNKFGVKKIDDIQNVFIDFSNPTKAKLMLNFFRDNFGSGGPKVSDDEVFFSLQEQTGSREDLTGKF